MSPVPLLISPAQLALLNNVVILDASWFMRDIPGNPRDQFLSKRISNAQYLDLDQVASSHELGLRHMMPEGRVFADACGTPFFSSNRVLVVTNETTQQRNLALHLIPMLWCKFLSYTALPAHETHPDTEIIDTTP